MKFETLPEIEKNSWIDFHKWAYEDDLVQAKETKSPRWKIIQGYYAMHDLAKLFLGEEFNLIKEAKRQRGKSQYYSDRFSISIFEGRLKKEADEFIENVVNPFINVLEGFSDDRNNTRK